MRRIHYPVLLRNVEEAKAGTFVGLFTLEAICRALLATIVPLLAYKYLQDAQRVTLLYLVLNAIGLVVGFTLPMLLHAVARRWVLTVGCLFYIVAGFGLARADLTGLVIGLSGQVLGTALLELTINLYLLDHIPRRDLNHFEPRRLLFSGTAFAAGPWLGVWLHTNLYENTTFYLVALIAVALTGYFWRQRLGDNEALQAATGPPPNPLRFLPRFLAQPRLVLAWTLAVGRNGWWLMFFVYVPIFVIEAGLDPQIGGALVSLGVAPMLLVRQWGRLGARYGIRQLLVASYSVCGVFTAAAGWFSGDPWISIVLLWLAAFTATVIDGAGNVPFLRAVHTYERSEMTSVFMTFRYATSLLMPALFAIVLTARPVSAVFIAGGGVAIAMAALSRYLPRRL
ncbi:MAG: MFS transporter [Aestuariivirgaceae bacterium]